MCFHKRAMSEPQPSDSVVALTPWDMALGRAVARPRVLSALDAPGAAEAVQALGELEVYHAVKSLGAHDATPVLGLMSVDQARTLFDLDVWHREQLEIADVLTWMDAFREAGISALETAARALDPEALAGIFRRRLLITLVPKDDASDPVPLPDWAAEPPEEILPIITTPDGRFYVAARAADEQADRDDELLDEEERKGILQLVDELYRTEDWEWVAGLLRMAESDLTSSLEEDARQFRAGRLEDLGFPPLERALEVYGPLDPAVLTEPAAARYPSLPETLPAAFVAPLSTGLFHLAMQRLDDPKVVARVEGDLVPLANAALVADGAEPGHLDHLQDTLSRARGYIELALAHGTAPGAERVETAALRLARHHVTALFRVGYTLTVRAAGRARALLQGGALAAEDQPLGLLCDAERQALSALGKKRPRYSEALDPWTAALARGERPAGGLDEARQHETRAFQAPEELAAVEALLADAEALARVAPRLAAGLAEADDALPPPEERTAQVVLATAAARALLGHAAEPRPLDAEALADLADRLVPPGRFRPEDLDRAEAAVAEAFGAEPAVARRVALGLAEAAETLWPLVGQAVDPRFVSGILVLA